MTNDELYSILRRYLLTDGVAQHALSLIWGQPFDGETEKIKPATEDSLATGSESLTNGTTYTRSYQVFLPTSKPIQTKPIFKTHQ